VSGTAARGRTPLAVAAAVLALACDHRRQPAIEYMPDMAHSVPYDTFAPNPNTRDGKTLLAPVAGTVPRGFRPLHYRATPEDAERAGRELLDPVARVPPDPARGRVLYATFCFVCHGRRGLADGPLVPRIGTPPSYTSERVRGLPAGQVFHAITYGAGRMPGYAAQVPPDDRWLIVRHVMDLARAEEKP
jgi:mono/diheme cytochrome c family protein